MHLREREAAATQYEVTYVLKGKTPMNLKRMVGVGSRLLLKLLSHGGLEHTFRGFITTFEIATNSDTPKGREVAKAQVLNGHTP